MKKILFPLLMVFLFTVGCSDGVKPEVKKEDPKPEPSETKSPAPEGAAASYFPLVDGATWTYDIYYGDELAGEVTIKMQKKDGNTFERYSEAGFNTSQGDPEIMGENLIGSAKFSEIYIKEGNQIKLLFSKAEAEVSSPTKSGSLNVDAQYTEPVLILNDHTSVAVGDDFSTSTGVVMNSSIKIGDNEPNITAQDEPIPVVVKYTITDEIEATDEYPQTSSLVQKLKIGATEENMMPYAVVHLAKDIGAVFMEGAMPWIKPFGISPEEVTLVLKSHNIPNQ
ncbi:hypothetical protein KKA47_01300 [bacterium]|nr:hypothetical protein [bacterium]